MEKPLTVFLNFTKFNDLLYSLPNYVSCIIASVFIKNKYDKKFKGYKKCIENKKLTKMTQIGKNVSTTSY